MDLNWRVSGRQKAVKNPKNRGKTDVSKLRKKYMHYKKDL
jgi:hypothetical protein